MLNIVYLQVAMILTVVVDNIWPSTDVDVFDNFFDLALNVERCRLYEVSLFVIRTIGTI